MPTTEEDIVREAKETQAVLAALFEVTPDFVGIADAVDGHFLFLNRAARRMAGRSHRPEDVPIGLRTNARRPAVDD